MIDQAFQPAALLLPKAGTDLTRWACVACDQYTSQPEYWQAVAQTVGDAPSTLRLMLPEVYLPETEARIPAIRAAMQEYLTSGILQNIGLGYVLTERTTAAGSRLGLVGCVDLEAYSFTDSAHAAIRPTEETVSERLPARIRIRSGAPVEMGHVMLLADDPQRTLIEPLYAARDELPCLYDFELMQGGGHLRGWLVAGESAEKIAPVLEQLKAAGNGLLFAVGDGNHSLATAKVCWENQRDAIPAEARENHPARFAMAEVVNIHDDALLFEPIHRVLTGVDADRFSADWQAAFPAAEGFPVTLLTAKVQTQFHVPAPDGLAVKPVQQFLDAWLKQHPEAAIDYIHGEDVVQQLSEQPNAVSILLPPIDKSRFFEMLRTLGVMPRKTFSMGEANEKRFYMECRRITAE